MIYCAATCYAGEVDGPMIKARELKNTSALSGVERMEAMQKYVCNLPDAQLIPLMEQVGIQRLLAQDAKYERYGQQGRTAEHPSLPGQMAPNSRHTLQQRLHTALHNQERKLRMCRNIANYLLNTTR